ncbi:hypothetical protein [Cognatiluteimonas telluris]|jgi:hypothetical protein|uniref:hypothetical protein n=1 Tax=Cognatiluteimonas telluris TaxID=1104775 RepID=UPI00140A096A|nr:hypothetical protein [Lysobacter telluris]
MNDRYFVTYKRLTSDTVETNTFALGRFFDLEAAQHRARERYNAPGYEILSVRQETRFEALLHKCSRFLIRLVRIAVGAALAGLAYSWLVGADYGLGDIPLSQLTLNRIFSALFHTALILGAAWLCWTIAFGEGPADSN